MNPPIPARHRRWPRVVLTLAVVVVLIALAAATFMLSYNGIHVLALNSGVSPRLARIYPGILDAALVIACLAALMLREGKWWARWYAWLAIIVMIVIGGGTNAIHAMNVPLPHRETAGVVSAAPWLLLLLAFSLWVTTLRQSRTRRAARSAQETRPAAEAVRKDDAPADTPDANEPEPEVAEASSSAESESEAPADESPEGESPESGQLAIIASRPLDYWDAGEGEGDILDASVVPAVPDITDPAPAADDGDEVAEYSGEEVAEYSDEEEALAQARRAGQPLAREVHHGTAELAPGSPAPSTPELPFSSAPSLRRMRSTPVPPDEEPEEDLADQP